MKLRTKINNALGALLINKYTGAFLKSIKTYLLRNDLKINISNKLISSEIVSSIYFNAYESAEIRFIKKYLNKEFPVVELGSSLGIVGCISAKISPQPIYGLEANPHLISLIENLKSENKIQNYFVKNYALSNSETPVFFELGRNNTLGRIVETESKNTIRVESVSLNKYLDIIGVKENYTLISDIEGAEAFFIFSNDLLEKCYQIIIELHQFNDGKKIYEVDEMLEAIMSKGFKKLDQHGNCFVFLKNHI